MTWWIFRLKHWLDPKGHSLNKIKLTFPSSINIKFFFSSDTPSTHSTEFTQKAATKDKTLGLWKDGGYLKKRNVWQSVWDGGMWYQGTYIYQFVVIQLYSKHINQYSLNKEQLMKLKGFYFPIRFSLFPLYSYTLATQYHNTCIAVTGI